MRASAIAAAAGLRVAGHDRPLIVATFPGFLANPFSRLMEQAYAGNGLAAVHVVSHGRDPGRHRRSRGRCVWRRSPRQRPRRFLLGTPAASEADALAAAAGIVDQLDGWLAAGVPLVTTIHNGPMLRDLRAEAERRVAQAIVDRASLVHLLTASTPAVLDGWLDLAAALGPHSAPQLRLGARGGR